MAGPEASEGSTFEISGRALAAIAVVIAVACVSAFMLLGVKPPAPATNQSEGPPAGMAVTDGEQALALAKAHFRYFPESVASINLSDEGGYWLVEVGVPGSNMTIIMIDSSTGSKRVQTGPVFTAPVDSREKAADIARFRNLNVSASAITSSATEWLFRYSSKNYAIDKSTGILRVVS